MKISVMLNPQRIIIILTLISSARAGICPSYPIIRDFDFSKYTGQWYHQDKQQTSWASPGRCWQSIYVRDGKSGEYRLKLRYQNTMMAPLTYTGNSNHVRTSGTTWSRSIKLLLGYSKQDGVSFEMHMRTGGAGLLESTLTLQGPRKPSVIRYSIPYTFMSDEFQILATDYNSYSIEYQCHRNGILPKTENIFLLTREKTPRAEVLQKAYSIMHRYGIDLRKLERVDQTCGGLSLEGVLRPEEMIAVQPWGNPVRETTPLLEQNEGIVYLDGNQVHDAETVEGVRRRDQHVSASHISTPQRRRITRVGCEGEASLCSARCNGVLNLLTVTAQVASVAFTRRRQPARWSDDAQRRVSLGQSLATRLWHVLHTPFK